MIKFIFTTLLFFSISAIADENNLSPLDQAYANAMENKEKEPAYYNLFLNTELFIPVHSYDNDQSPKTGVTFDPILMKTDGVLVLMLFDSRDRLRAWGNDDMAYVSMPGRTVVEAMGTDIHWALNVGTGNMKVFVPQEIQWINELVKASKVEEHRLPRGTKVFITSPDNASQELITSIVKTLSEFPEVKSAFLASVTYESASEKPHLILAIDTDNLSVSAKNQLNDTLTQSVIGLFAGNEYLDITYIADTGTGKKISETVEPIYTADDSSKTLR